MSHTTRSGALHASPFVMNANCYDNVSVAAFKDIGWSYLAWNRLQVSVRAVQVGRPALQSGLLPVPPSDIVQVCSRWSIPGQDGLNMLVVMLAHMLLRLMSTPGCCLGSCALLGPCRACTFSRLSLPQMGGAPIICWPCSVRCRVSVCLGQSAPSERVSCCQTLRVWASAGHYAAWNPSLCSIG